MDEISINGLLTQINMEKTSVVVISKSGETIETLAQFFFLKKDNFKNKKLQKKNFCNNRKKNSTLKKFKNRKIIFLSNIIVRLVGDILCFQWWDYFLQQSALLI